MPPGDPGCQQFARDYTLFGQEDRLSIPSVAEIERRFAQVESALEDLQERSIASLCAKTSKPPS
jgi:uncharacterized small protein (DUF1192 family)